jgi:anti-anti-sigma factor
VQVDVLEPGARLALRGRLDAATVARARDAVQEALGCGSGDLAVELADAEVRDPSGLAMLVAAHRLARQTGRRLVLTGVPPTLMRVLRVTRLHLVLHLDERTPAPV